MRNLDWSLEEIAAFNRHITKQDVCIRYKRELHGQFEKDRDETYRDRRNP